MKINTAADLREWINSHGMTIEKAAMIFNRSQSAMFSWLSGKRNMPAQYVQMIAGLYDEKTRNRKRKQGDQ